MTFVATQPGPRRQPREAASAVGPAAWAALVTTNFTALGIIGATTVISRPASVAACGLYAAGLAAAAACLDARPSRDCRQAVSVLWVLACAALFAAGAMAAGAPGLFEGAAAEVVIDEENSSTRATATSEPTPAPTAPPLPPLSNDLTQVLPPDSSDELLAWARDDSPEAARRPSFRAFEGGVWFAAADAEGNETVLWCVRADGASRPFSEILSPHSFVLFGRRLFFSAAAPQGTGESLWFVRGRGAEEPEVFESPKYTAVKQLFVVGEGRSELLYVKVEYLCPRSRERVVTVLRLSTFFEVADLRPGACAGRGHPRPGAGAEQQQLASDDGAGAGAAGAGAVAAAAAAGRGRAAAGGAAGSNASCSMDPQWLSACCGSDRKHRAWHARLWGALLIADLPMMGVATAVLVLRQVAGLFLNLFAGVWVAVTAALVLAWDLDHGGFVGLQRDVLPLYTALLWLGILLVTVLVPHPPRWLEGLRQWAIKCTAPTFLGAMHLKLGIPATSLYWRWVVYALLVVAHVPAAALVRDPLPVLLSMVGLFVLAWKNSHLLIDITGIQDSPTGELVFLIVSMCLQGAGILAGGVACLKNLQQSQDIVAQVLQGCKLHWLQASEEDEYYEE